MALTRAKRHLHIYAPLRYHHGDPAVGPTSNLRPADPFSAPGVDGLLDHRAIRGTDDLDLAVAPPSPRWWTPR